MGTAKVIKLSKDKQTRDEEREVRKMRVRTEYSLRGVLVLTTKSFYACNAAPNALRNMQYDEFDADLVEVFSIETGKVYLVVSRDVEGDIHVHLNEKIKKGE